MSAQIAKRPKMDVESGNGAQRKSTLPRKTCDLSTHKFAAIIGCAAFIDKTLFIKAFFETRNSVIAILAPRRFGKSTNMDMVREFVSGNKKLFEDNRLKIYEEERDFFIKNCKENPVIHVDFKNMGGKTEDEVFLSIKMAIQCAYNDHKYLVKEVGENYVWSDEKLELTCTTVEEFVRYWKTPVNVGKVEAIDGLKLLSECLHMYYGKHVYVFIDEYDAHIIGAIMQTNQEDQVLNETSILLSEMMSCLLKGNKYVKRALINACVREASMPWGYANNIIYYTFLREPEFAPYFGFTDREVKDLFERDEFIHLKNYDEIEKWYNGYRLMHTNEYVIYSSYSILKYLQKSREMDKPQFDTYWVDSASIVPNLKELFAKAEIRQLIEKLHNEEEVTITTVDALNEYEILTLKSLVHQQLLPSVTEAHLFLQFLSENGYLNVVSAEYNRSTLRVPNKEIKKLLKENCYNVEFFIQKYQLCPSKIDGYVEGLHLLLQQRDRDAFIRFAKAVSELFEGALIPHDENELHSILFTVAYNIKLYKLQSELSVQRIKRSEWYHFDILVVLDDVGMIIELKCKDKSSEMAHTQIVTQRYVTAFGDYRNITVKILLGLHINENRKVSLTYTVDDSVKQTVTSND